VPILSVSSVAYPQADVFSGGLLQPAWVPGGSTAVVFAPDVRHTFALWLTENTTLALAAVTAQCTDATFCAVQALPPVPAPLPLSVQPQQVSLAFVCLRVGGGEVRVSLSVAGFSPMVFAFTKQCGGALSRRLFFISVPYFRAASCCHRFSLI
jgi:hypothetical protein